MWRRGLSSGSGSVEPTRIIIVGTTPRAGRWAELARKSPRLHLVEVVVADELPARILEPAGREQLGMQVVAAVGPRAGLQLADSLDEWGVAALLDAPIGWPGLSIAPRSVSPVQVAHDWVTLPGLGWLQRHALEGLSRQSIRVRGTPTGDSNELIEVLVHALALVRRLAQSQSTVTVESADYRRAEVRFDGPVPLRLSVECGQPMVEVAIEGTAGERRWRHQGDVDHLSTRDGTGIQERSRPVPPADVRALAPDVGSGEKSGLKALKVVFSPHPVHEYRTNHASPSDESDS